jgi:hypothetical protein
VDPFAAGAEGVVVAAPRLAEVISTGTNATRISARAPISATMICSVPTPSEASPAIRSSGATVAPPW